jgi:hypothetical protein
LNVALQVASLPIAPSQNQAEYDEDRNNRGKEYDGSYWHGTLLADVTVPDAEEPALI